jgi:hypothetical protein
MSRRAPGGLAGQVERSLPSRTRRTIAKLRNALHTSNHVRDGAEVAAAEHVILATADGGFGMSRIQLGRASEMIEQRPELELLPR